MITPRFKHPLEIQQQIQHINNAGRLSLLSKLSWEHLVDLLEVGGIEVESVPIESSVTLDQEWFVVQTQSALARFSQHIQLPENFAPSIKLTPWKNKIFPQLLALVLDEIESKKGQLITESWIVQKRMFKEIYDLDIPQEQFEEYTSYASEVFKELPTLMPEVYEADIIVYEGNLHYLSQETWKQAVVHETFHLLEQQHAIRYTPPIIREWTATFVQNYFSGTPCTLPQGNTYGSLVYDGMAYYIAEFLKTKGESSPIQAILAWKYKQEFEELYRIHIEPLVTTLKVDTAYYRDWHKQSILLYLREKPIFSAFVEDPTPDNLILALAANGQPQCAAWLKEQPNFPKLFAVYEECARQVKKEGTQS